MTARAQLSLAEMARVVPAYQPARQPPDAAARAGDAVLYEPAPDELGRG